MDLSAFYTQFREETAEHVRTLGDGLLALEHERDAGARKATLDQIFRAVHTVKGSARMLGFEPVGRLAHAMEHTLGELRQGRRTLDRPLADVLLRGGDALLALAATATGVEAVPVELEALLAMFDGATGAQGTEGRGDGEVRGREGERASGRKGEQADLFSDGMPASPGAPLAVAPALTLPQPAAFQASPRPVSRQTVRVRVDRLDRMLNLAGELTVGRQVLAAHVEELQALQALATRQSQALTALESELARLRFSPSQRAALDGRLAALRELLDAGDERAQGQAERFARHSFQHGQLVEDLEQEVMAARLMPIATVYAGLPRAVRDLAQATGKAVRLELLGEGVELDRKVLELLNDPLLHLIRNAVDHGLELPAEREAAGKPSEGHLEVRAEAAGGEVRVVVEDDGRGMDPQLLRERAVRLGLLRPEAAALLPNAEALELIFQPGFSTASMVTELSGRGVGMDVVRSNLLELGGQVHVESQPGRGTRIVLTLPLTLVTTRVLLVQVGGTAFALPASACRGIVWVRRDELAPVDGQPTIERDGVTVAVVALGELLGVPGEGFPGAGERAPAVLVGGGQRRLALLVEALLDEREAVVKSLGTLLARQRRFGGAVQLGDGSLVLLLNPLLLTQGARSASPAPRQAPRRRARLLVADDSFTTRELIRSILQSAGYEVVAAVDGADALERLRAQPFDLVVSDVEMPRLDGFQLAASISAGRGVAPVPVVLITSLASDEQRRRGLEAGARAYIVKSQFNQESLLDVVRQLLG